MKAMGRKGRRDDAPASWESERTMAAAEEDAREQASRELPGAGEGEGVGAQQGNSRCACGSDSLLLQAFVQIVDGRPQPGFVEAETLTCPECSREYEPIQTDDGRVLRGDFLGYFEAGEDA
jgi:hypothetical protein